MYSIWRDAFRIPQLTLLSLPPRKDVKHLVRTLQNESLSNALETFSTDREGQIKLVIDFFTFVSWILRLFYWITISTTKGWIFLNGPSCFERLWLAVLTGEHVSVCLPLKQIQFCHLESELPLCLKFPERYNKASNTCVIYNGFSFVNCKKPQFRIRHFIFDFLIWLFKNDCARKVD